MSAFFSTFVTALIVIPFLGYILIFIVSKQLTKDHRRAVRISLDVSTFLFIFSVHYLIFTIWKKSFLWLILLVVFAVGILVVFVHWKFKEEIDIPKVLRGILRINFLVFFSAYIILFVFGIIRSITMVLS